MSTTVIQEPVMRELMGPDNREQRDGLQVYLLFNEQTKETFIVVEDDQGETPDLMYPIAPEKALDAFRHPFRYQPGARL